MYIVSCCVLANFRGSHRNLSDVSFTARGGQLIFSETLVSSRRHISEFMFSGFDKPMQLLKGEIDRFRGLTLYTYVMTFRPVDSTIMRVGVVKS